MSDKYSNVDWSRTNATIARELGVSREWVRQKRKSLKIRKVEWHGCRPDLSNYLRNHKDQLKDKTIEEITAEVNRAGFPLVQPTVHRYLLDNKIRHRRKGFDWSKVNWALPNTVIAEIWNKAYVTVCNRRSQRGLGKPAWDITFGQNKEDPGLQKAIGEEKIKVDSLP